MKLIIEDTLRGNRKYIENATIIPRKGESVAWDYHPMPKVKKVVYDFHANEVFVTIE